MSVLGVPRVDRRLVAAGGRFVVVLAVLLAPWPGLPPAFASAFCSAANVASVALLRDEARAIQFEPGGREGQGASPLAAWQVTMDVRDVATGTTARPRVGLRVLLYLPLCIFVALSIGAPWAGQRGVVQLAAIGAGAVLLMVFLSASVSAASWRFCPTSGSA